MQIRGRAGTVHEIEFDAMHGIRRRGAGIFKAKLKLQRLRGYLAQAAGEAQRSKQDREPASGSWKERRKIAGYFHNEVGRMLRFLVWRTKFINPTLTGSNGNLLNESGGFCSRNGSGYAVP